MTGIELSRIVIPARCERYTATNGADSWWPTPEPPHRVNQTYFEPVLFAHASAQPRIRIFNRTEIQGFVQDEHGVTATGCNLDTGESLSIACAYLVGCDGGKSAIRNAIGARLTGASEIQHVQSTYIHAPALIDLLPGKPAWMYLSLNPRRCGMTIAVDGHNDGSSTTSSTTAKANATQSIVIGRSARSLASERIFPTGSFRNRTGSAGALWLTSSVTGALSSVEMPRTCGCRIPATE